MSKGPTIIIDCFVNPLPRRDSEFLHECSKLAWSLYNDGFTGSSLKVTGFGTPFGREAEFKVEGKTIAKFQTMPFSNSDEPCDCIWVPSDCDVYPGHFFEWDKVWGQVFLPALRPLLKNKIEVLSALKEIILDRERL